MISTQDVLTAFRSLNTRLAPIQALEGALRNRYGQHRASDIVTAINAAIAQRALAQTPTGSVTEDFVRVTQHPNGWVAVRQNPISAARVGGPAADANTAAQDARMRLNDPTIPIVIG